MRGIKTSHHTKSNAEGVEKILFEMENKSRGLIFANLVDFDQQFGHRQDPIGFANALMEFDQWLPQIEKKLNENDILILTADHGNDPTDDSTDHSREFVPLLVFSNRQQTGKDLGTRQTFSDIAQTIGEYFSLNCNDLAGKSFLKIF